MSEIKSKIYMNFCHWRWCKWCGYSTWCFWKRI